MRVFINFPARPGEADLSALLAIQARGAVVTYEKKRSYTAAEFAREHGLHPRSISRLLHDPRCPEFTGQFGPTGSVRRFDTNLELVDFLTSKRK